MLETGWQFTSGIYFLYQLTYSLFYLSFPYLPLTALFRDNCRKVTVIFYQGVCYNSILLREHVGPPTSQPSSPLFQFLFCFL